MFLKFLKLPLEKKKNEDSNLRGGTILVVEDDDANRDSLCGRLGDEGYQVKSAGLGKYAGSALHGGQRDCSSKMLVSKRRKPVELEEVLYLAKRYASHECSPGIALPLTS